MNTLNNYSLDKKQIFRDTLRYGRSLQVMGAAVGQVR